MYSACFALSVAMQPLIVCLMCQFTLHSFVVQHISKWLISDRERAIADICVLAVYLRERRCERESAAIVNLEYEG